MSAETKFLLVLAFWFLLFAEGLSWVTAGWPGDCIINPEQNAAANNQAYQNNCPTFHVGVWIAIKRADRMISRHDKSIVAIFTAVLAISTIGLWSATFRLGKAGEQQLELIASNASQQSSDMQASIEVASRAAAAAEKAAEAARIQSEVTRDINRPYVFVFGVKNIEPGPNENLDGAVPYLVANHGQAPAIIERFEYALTPGTEPSETGAAWDDHPLVVVSPVLGIGDQVSWKAVSVAWIDSGTRVIEHGTAPDFKDSKHWAIPKIEEKGTTWFFRVRVFYRGPFSDGHETSTCWRYDLEPCQFVQYGGTDYNYVI